MRPPLCPQIKGTPCDPGFSHSFFKRPPLITLPRPQRHKTDKRNRTYLLEGISEIYKAAGPKSSKPKRKGPELPSSKQHILIF